ncbi:MAG: hypothetical protein ACTH31_10185, partial [Pseudoclavibacter sp.]
MTTGSQTRASLHEPRARRGRITPHRTRAPLGMATAVATAAVGGFVLSWAFPEPGWWVLAPL